MNKKSAIVITLASAIFLVTPTFAQDSSTQRLSIENKRLEMASKSSMVRQKIENVRTKIASREASVKLKLAKFKDQQKAAVAERVNTNLNKINQNQTDQMLKHLDKMLILLDKLADDNQGSRALIESAKTAVEAQAQKDYTITVTTETKIRADAQAKRNQLHKDINAVRSLVIEAKQSVSNAVRVAKLGSKEATVSGQQ